jgi:hypothetical protein
MENKIFKLSDIRKLNKQVSLGEISSTKMVEILNEMAYEYYIDKAQNVLDGFTNEAPGQYIKTNFIGLLNKQLK